MVADPREAWVNYNSGYPKIVGNLEISSDRNGVFIGGDPSGLLSLAKLLEWIANTNQDRLENIPIGAHFHIHLYHDKTIEAFNSLNEFSKETQICRLDAKGTGEFPEKYNKKK